MDLVDMGRRRSVGQNGLATNPVSEMNLYLVEKRKLWLYRGGGHSFNH